MRSSANSSLFFEEQTWLFTAVTGKDGYKVVETDLTDVIKVDFLTKESAQHDEADPDEWKYYHSVSRLVIITSPDTGKKTGFIMTLIPSKEYIDKHKERLGYNTYLYRELDYDGTIIFHHIDGTLCNGWIYKDGKITGEISPKKKSNENQFISNFKLSIIYSKYEILEKNKSQFKSYDHDNNDGTKRFFLMK
ncbi:hypothetical protein [Porphyromonas pogonae]|uniref:hypothetical protein n=1 Tax=Porphyromonas pogonae TaxID=867595 RepID=UPI002E7873E6|nr:hypothetical protein [Porphyromonas pogonae]